MPVLSEGALAAAAVSARYRFPVTLPRCHRCHPMAFAAAVAAGVLVVLVVFATVEALAFLDAQLVEAGSVDAAVAAEAAPGRRQACE